MISQNIRFKPFQVRSKTFLRHSWLITPLGDILCLRALKTWLKIYRNPHDTKILRGLYSAFLIHLAGFNLGSQPSCLVLSQIESPRYQDTHKTYCLIYCPNLLCGFTSLPLIVIRRYLIRMLIHSKIPSLPVSWDLQCLRIYVRDTKILVLEEELETIELIVGIIPVFRILAAQLIVVLFKFLVQIVHLLTLILIDLL